MSLEAITFKSNGERGKRKVIVHFIDSMRPSAEVSAVEGIYFLTSGMVQVVGRPGVVVPNSQILMIEYSND